MVNNLLFVNIIMEKKLKEKPFVVVDLNSGRYVIDRSGHEVYNLEKNKVDNRYYGYCPPHDRINIQKLGAKRGAKSVDDVMVVYVKKMPDSNDRQIIAFCDSVTAYKLKQFNPLLKRRIKTNGKMEDCTFSIESDYMYDLRNYPKKFIIHIAEYSISMFRAQRFYKGTYPKLDKKILDYLENYLNPSESADDIGFQQEIQQEDSSKVRALPNDSTEEPSYSTGVTGRQVAKKSRVAKAALIEAGFKCAGNEKHVTFTTTRGDVYMEGHHLIPCTCTNSEYFWNNYSVNIDCVENVVCLCPICHRLVHFGSEKERNGLLEKLYHHQIATMKTVGIEISLDELLNLYKR